MNDLSGIALGERPLVVCDVDDVALQFIGPFQAFLEAHGYRLAPRSFRLHGNIVSTIDDSPAEGLAVTELIAGFFDAQERWQVPSPDAVEALHRLSHAADIVFLTAMPPRFYDQRRRLLDSVGMNFPLVATEDAKGPFVARLHGGRRQPVAFVDDMVNNLQSVGDHVAGCLLVHMPPESEIHRFAPETPAIACRAGNWLEADSLIRNHFAT